MIKKRLAQIIFNNIISSNLGRKFDRIKFKIFVKLKDKLRITEIVRYNLKEKEIFIPFNHDLPLNKILIPVYSDNIGRIALYLQEKYPDLRVIDIGANIGDSAVIIKSKADMPILCIEGDEKYFSLLKRNVSQWKDVFIEKCFVGIPGNRKGEYIHHKGSGKIIENENDGSNIHFENLDSILERNPLFRDIKLIKIDTDGFDCRIIRSEIDLISKLKPVIFFEYDPYFLNNINDDGLSIFNDLYKINYRKMIIYENTGEYLLSVELNQKQIIEDIHYFYSGRGGGKYCDICIFHSDDSELADLIRKKEIKFFKNYRRS